MAAVVETAATGADAGAGTPPMPEEERDLHAATQVLHAAVAQVQPQEADLRQYGFGLGVDLDRDPDLTWVVQEAFNAPLPGSWTEHTDAEGRVFFFKEASSQSTWEHPMDAVYRELIGLILHVREEQPLASEAQRVVFVQEAVNQVHQQALRSLEGWSGPYASEDDGGEYYYNITLQVSSWECPLTEWEHELAIRHTVLCRCILPELSIVGADGSLELAAGTTIAGLPSLHLPLNLVRRDLGDANVEEPSTSRSFHTARSVASTRSQPFSGRSGDKTISRDKAAAPRSPTSRTAAPGSASGIMAGTPAQVSSHPGTFQQSLNAA